MRSADGPSGIVGPIDDLQITPQLAVRPSRSPDHAAENRALAALVQEMAGNPGGVLQKCAELAMELCGADSAGFSIQEPGGTGGVLRWHAAAGAFAADLGGAMPPEASSCGTMMKRDGVLLFDGVEHFFPVLLGVEPRIHETLLAPWPADGGAVGMLWAIKHTPEGRFDAEDARLLAGLARFASAAHRMTDALAAAEAGRQGLERRVEERTHDLSRANAALRESEERFRSFAEASVDAIYIVDAANRRLEYLSPGYESIWNEPRGAVLRDLGRWDELLHPDDRDAAAAGQRALYEDPAAGLARVEYRIVRASDGAVRHIHDTAVPIRDAAGRVVRVAGIARDVTDRRLAEARLAESEGRLRVLMEGIPQLVWRGAPDGAWTWAGPQWSAFTGQLTEESLGQGWLRAVHPDDRPTAHAAWTSALGRGELVGDWRLRRAGDASWRWFQTRAIAVRDAAGGTVEWLGTCTDIDDQVRAREVLARGREGLEALVAERTAELTAAEAALRQSQKMEAVGQLTGGIAHDFNNMLQGVAGGLEMARRRIADGRAAEAERYLDAAREAAGRAAGLTRRLLAFARRQRLDPKPVDADALVVGMADLVRRTVGPGISVELKLCDGAGGVLCDAGELESALLNLCINARDAMPEGGRLAIATEDTRPSAAEIAGQEGLSPGDYTVVSVSDTGQGMPPEVLERVFEPFFTTKPLGQGTGLGLSQVWGFARQSGGLVRLESAPGRGTVVRIFLPRHARSVAAPEEQTPAAAQEGAGAGSTVLLVDDEDAVRCPAAERLREVGFRVLEAADGSSALRMLGGGARIDLLVTDVGLPNGMNGRQVAEAVRERVPRVPVLFITGYAGAALPPGTEVIGKPFELDALARRVQALLGRGTRGGVADAEPLA